MPSMPPRVQRRRPRQRLDGELTVPFSWFAGGRSRAASWKARRLFALKWLRGLALSETTREPTSHKQHVANHRF